MDGLKTWMYEKYTDISNYVSNPNTVSKFLEEGTLTPEEFVQAGDLLTMKCPSWVWVGNSKNPQKGLPVDKQYLLTRNVPCAMRVSTFHAKTEASDSKDIIVDGECWVETNINDEPSEDAQEIPEIPTEKPRSNNDSDDDDEEAAEINLADLSIQGGSAELNDPSTINSNSIIKTRSYDLTICYDQYHQTPRVWLFGYDENRQPLKPEEVLQDISQEHVNKTVTIASHPHTNIPQAYIHPCRHAAVMKKLVQRMIEAEKVPRVDQYLFIFLKFIHAAIPTIEYDYTMEMNIK